MKRALSPLTNAAGLTAAGMAVYAAILMVTNAVHSHGVIDVPVIVAAVSAVAALYTRQKVTPVADPKDGNGQPLVSASAPTRFAPGGLIPPSGNVTVQPPPAPPPMLP
jgi:hypothetical protein